MTTDDYDFQVPPMSIEAEQLLLGGLMLDPGPIHDVMELVTVDDFYKAENRTVYSAIASLADAGDQIDAVLVSEKCEQIDSNREYLAYAVELAQSASGSANAKSYARVIRDKALKRKLLMLTNELSRKVLTDPSLTAEQAIEFAQSKTSELDTGEKKNSNAMECNESLRSFVEDLDRRFKSESELMGISTGFDSIDQVTAGWKPGELITIAGRPSMGKTAFALQATVCNLSVYQKRRGIYFSLEMGINQLTQRLVSCVGRIDHNILKFPKRGGEELWPKLESGARKIKDSDYIINDCPGANIHQIKAYSRACHRRKNLDYIVIDHIHLMSSNIQSRVEQISEITRELKSLAKELQIPVIQLAQLSRKVEERSDKQPMMSDLRDGGTIEQDSDVICFVYRDDYYNEDPNNPNKGLIQLDFAKVRDGERTKVYFQNAFYQCRLDPTSQVMCHGKRSHIKAVREAL